jgi:hypothetical protein
MVDLFYFRKEGMDNIMAGILKIRMTQQMANVILASGKQVIKAEHIISTVQQILT